jgi:predicted transcriptional regulator
VGELAEECGIQSHMASEHLKMMKDRGLLKAKRQGRKVFYTIAEPSLCTIISCIEKRFGK